MICHFCSNSFAGESSYCPHCGKFLGETKILTPEERDNFSGVTIDGLDDQKQDSWYEYTKDGSGQRVYVRRINANYASFGLLRRIIVTAVIVGLIMLTLPTALFTFGFIVIGWLLTGFLRR